MPKPVMRSMSERVFLVIARRRPAKVLNSVVKVIAVVMAGNHAFWARPYKRFQHELMHE